MVITDEMQNSVPFQYAKGVLNGSVFCGNKIKKAVHRFYLWIETADKDGYYIDHAAGMFIINFFEHFLNHTKGKLQGQPFVLQPFQQFTLYNVFGWKDSRNLRRINTVYDKRAKKNGKSAEMAGVGLFCMSFDCEMEAEIYVGATKEDQAKLVFNQARQFIDSPVANPNLKKIGFYTQQKIIGNKKTQSILRPLGGDSKTQDGINSHLSIIDEYHAHKDDGVKENLESSSVQRSQPLLYHITTAGENNSGVCKQYEDSVIEVLEGRNVDDHLFIMIHDLDENDDWENPDNWYKANPLLQSGALDIKNLQREYIKAKNQPSKIPNFKTKHLNIWVDALNVWIDTEIFRKNYIKKVPFEKFKKFGCIAACDLSTNIDITALVFLSEPDENDIRYLIPYAFCPEETINKRSKEDKVPYRFWRDQGFLISTPGNMVDYSVLEDVAVDQYFKLNCKRIEFDKWNSSSTVTRLSDAGLEVSYFSQAISNFSHPTKTFEKLIYQGKIKYKKNPLLEWMLTGCVIIEDANENVKVHKGRSNRNGKRVDLIIASIMALGGSISVQPKVSKYSKPLEEDEIVI
jgi:phage terminase large subunit-like protein